MNDEAIKAITCLTAAIHRHADIMQAYSNILTQSLERDQDADELEYLLNFQVGGEQ